MELLNHRTTEPPNQSLPGWAFCALLGLMMASGLFSQTEVSGEVSGEWTAEDSPYIVVDSTWVPEDEELRIEAGVTVQFEEDEEFTVAGSLIGNGSEEDTISFELSPESEGSWGGLILESESEVILEYTKLLGSEVMFRLRESANLSLNNTLMHSNSQLLTTEPAGYNSRITIANSQAVSESDIMIRIMRSRIVLENSTFTPGEDRTDFISLLFSSIEIDNCDIFGELGGFETTVRCANTRFGSVNDSIPRYSFSASSSTYLTNTYINGTLRLDHHMNLVGNVVTGNVDLGSIDERSEIHDNYFCTTAGVFDGLNITNTDSVRIYRCSINRLECRNVEYAQIDSCVIPNGSSFQYCDRVVYTKNDTKGIGLNGNNSVEIFENEMWGNFATRDNEEVIFRRNVMYNGQIRTHDSRLLVDHNTFKTSEEEEYRAIEIWGRGHFIDITNNIFIGNESDCDIVDLFNNGAVTPDIDYNCFWGFRGWFMDGREEFEPGEGNLFTNPLFIDIDDEDYHLTEHSPCIDSGKPGYPPDPDSTRNDMGVFYYHHELDIAERENLHLTPQYELLVSPNPANSEVRLFHNIPEKSINSVRLFDQSGREVLVNEFQTNPYPFQINNLNLRHLPDGMYFLQIESDRQNVSTAKITLVK